MKKIAVLFVVILAMAFAVPAGLKAEVKLGVSLGNTGVNSFYFSVGQYNRVPENEVIVVRQEGIPDEELPVVFFLASKANVHYSEIVKLRLKKWGWAKIAMKYNLEPDIFYVPVNGEVRGNVYGRSYGYYNGKNPHSWKHIKLNDNDVVNFVNLRFVSEHYGYAPDQVIKMREGGKNFVTINNDITTERTKVVEQDKKKMFWQKKTYDKKHSGKYDYEKKELKDYDYGVKADEKQGNKVKGNNQQELNQDDTKLNKQDKGNSGNDNGSKKNNGKGNGKDNGKHGNR